MSTDLSGNNQSNLLPLTGAQRNVWYHQLIDPTSVAYNIGQTIRFDGKISNDLFVQAQNNVWWASESLRIRIIVVKGEPFQEILPLREAPFEQADLRKAEDIDQALQAAIEKHQLRPFDLTNGPCCRFALFQIADNQWVWSMAVHHLALDAPGGSYFTTLLAQTFKDLTIHPVDLETIAQHDWVQAIENDRDYQTSERFRKDKEYWLNATDGLVSPPSFSRLPVNTLNLAIAKNAFHSISRDTYEKFANWSISNGQSLYAGFATAFCIYLSRLTGETDICIGSPTSGRNKKSRGLIGMLSNAIALRLQINQSDCVLDVLNKTARQNRQNLRHNSFPIGELTQERRKQGHASPFSLVVNLLVFDQQLDFGTTSGAVETLSTGSVADLQLNIFDRTDGESVELRMDFNPARYKQEEIEGHLERIGNLINKLPELEKEAIANLPILKTEEKQLLIVQSAGPILNALSNSNNNLIDQFYASVNMHANAQALHYMENDQTFSVTYETLNQRSNQLARYLIAQGVKTDQIVAVLLDRSVNQIVSMLAIMKAGAAYLPIDPEYPLARQTYMLADSQAYAVISSTQLLNDAENLFDTVTTKKILLDEAFTHGEVIKQSPVNIESDELFQPIRSTNLAYLIYTSGSTGMPKGAGNTHEAILNRLEWMQDTLRLNHHDRVLQKTGLGFDVAVWEWFLPLMTGSSLVVSSPQGHKDPVYLKQMIEQFQITVMHFVPSMLSVFLKFLSRGDCSSIQQIVTSGEALSAELQDETLSQYPELKLWNLYGPTEAAIDVSVWECDVETKSVAPPIGVPIWNTQLYILDKSLELVPPGAMGELYIAGLGLARGYLGRPGLTSERFVACPFTSTHETALRMYRTGDLAYRREDGAIMYVGRADNQIKIRGFRVELGEIESSIRQCFKSLSQVIVIDQRINQDQTLVCYVVPDENGIIPELLELHNQLSLTMPSYMLPSYIISLEAVPLTANGKLDRKALPLPSAELNISQFEYVAPESSQETYLCHLFEELTGKQPVSVLDSFFAIGGHSLLAMRLIASVKDSLGVLIPLKTLFDFPSVRALAPHLVLKNQNLTKALVPGQGIKQDNTLSLSYGQERLWTLDQVEGASATYNMPSLIKLNAQLNLEALRRAINMLVSRHESLRTVIESDLNSMPAGKLLPVEDSNVTIEMIETIASRFDDMVKIESAKIFNLSHEVSVRVALLTEQSRHLALLVTFHHQACDGVSREVFFKELDIAYSAFVNGQNPLLPVNPVSYADWAFWQKENVSNEIDLKIQRAQERLKDMPELLTLPLDFVRNADRLRHAGYVHATLPNKLVVQLESLANKLNTTLFSVLQIGRAHV
jgi:nonribosomal peptide synthetase DhbF